MSSSRLSGENAKFWRWILIFSKSWKWIGISRLYRFSQCQNFFGLEDIDFFWSWKFFLRIVLNISKRTQAPLTGPSSRQSFVLDFRKLCFGVTLEISAVPTRHGTIACLPALFARQAPLFIHRMPSHIHNQQPSSQSKTLPFKFKKISCVSYSKRNNSKVWRPSFPAQLFCWFSKFQSQKNSEEQKNENF